jgi:Terminase small subunit
MARLRNTKHERFAREIAALTPMQEAYRVAGFSGDERWFRFNASRLRNKPKVKARIEELRLQFEQLSAISADYVRHKLLGFVEFDVRDLYEIDPVDATGRSLRLRPLNDLSERARKSIEKLKLDPETGRPVEITLAGRVSSATTLLRSLPGGAVDENVALQFTKIERVIVPVLAGPAQPGAAKTAAQPAQLSAHEMEEARQFLGGLNIVRR